MFSPRQPPHLAAGALLAMALVLGGFLPACTTARGTRPRAGELESGDGQAVRSNVLRGDYAGSDACEPCHLEIFEKWQRSPMHRMTRDAATAEIHAPFDGATFHFMGDQARMVQHGRQRFIHVQSSHDGPRLFRVTKVIGGRYREDFVGVWVTGPEDGARELDVERVLPVSFLRFSGDWRYKGYSVMTPERSGLRQGAVWQRTCIFCHNTPPALATLYDELHGDGAPVYQGSASLLLPADRSPRFQVTDAGRLRFALADELARLDSDAAQAAANAARTDEALRVAIAATRKHFGETDLIELGIGCEACHGGSREHAEDPLHRRPTFALASDFARVRTATGAAPSPAEDLNRTCARCHTVLFSRYPHTWEGGHRRGKAGGSNINSGEARDFLLGGCASRLSCVACHDPHGEDPPGRLDSLVGPAGDALCTGCHSRLQDPETATAHTHHSPSSAGSACVACHMPRKNLALDYTLTRYHRIGSPTDPERVDGDRPLECALCHGDRSVEFLVTTMETWWGRRYDRAALRVLYGPDLETNVLAATLRRGKAHEQATAASVAGELGLSSLLPEVVARLDNQYPLVRFHAHAAIEALTGEPLQVDLHAPGPELLRAARRELERRATSRALE